MHIRDVFDLTQLSAHGSTATLPRRGMNDAAYGHLLSTTPAHDSDRTILWLSNFD